MARERREPRPLSDVVGAVGRDLGADDPRRIARIATDWDDILGLQADCARPGDSYYPIRAFPLRRQLVGILG